MFLCNYRTMKKFNILLVDDHIDIYNLLKEILFFEIGSKINDYDDLLDDNDKTLDNSLGDFLIQNKSSINLIYSDNGKDSVKIFEEKLNSDDQIDLIIMDMRMPPGINGLEALKRIVKISSNFKGFICSAYSDHSLNEVKRELGQDMDLAWIEKPFNLEDFRDLIRAKLEVIDILKYP